MEYRIRISREKLNPPLPPPSERDLELRRKLAQARLIEAKRILRRLGRPVDGS